MSLDLDARTASSRRLLRTILAITGALAVCVGLLSVTAAPSAAATSTFTQPGGIIGGGDDLTFSSADPISIPAAGTGLGPADPYASEILVPYDAPVLDVTVELALTHTYPADLDLLLVGPGGQQALVMSDAGGSTDVSNVRFSFSDDAGNMIPIDSPPQNETYLPSNYIGQPDSFPAPAPALTGNTSLGVFDGTSAAGIWRLYTMDDALADSGSISTWSLTFDLEATPYPSTLDITGVPPITDVNVTLDGFTSTYPDDMDVLLVGPGGQQATVMSDAGGNQHVSDVDLTFDDEAASATGDNGPLVGGSFPPADYLPGKADYYGAGNPTPNGNTELNVFDGISPNGRWRLFFRDDSPNDASTITGWSLEFSYLDTQAPSGSVTVANGAATTSNHAVALKVIANDPAPSGGVAQMRFSNDGVTFSAYQPYATTTTWTLAPGAGAKTVFAQFRDADGNESAIVSDTITVVSGIPADTTGPRSVTVSPVSGAKGVKTSTRVKVKAGEPLAPGSVKAQTVLLKANGSSHRVKAALAYRSSSHTIVLSPRSHVKHHTTYRVTVKGVMDLAGNAWDQKPAEAGAQALTYKFKTR